MSSNIFFKKLKRIYNGKTYFEKYGGDLWLCFILITLFTSISTYFHVSGQINTLKTSWVDNKCNPRYMPFANIMNKDKNVYQSGWNIFSLDTMKLIAKKNNKKMKAIEFKMPFDIKKRKNDLIRTWTVEFEGKRQWTNGLGIIYHGYWVEIS